MADENQTQAAANTAAQNQNTPDPKFFECVNEYLETANKQSREFGEPRISMATMYAAARFNSHVFLLNVKPIHAATERKDFLDYMSTMYRRMLNEHLDNLGQERGIDVGESELADDYRAAGIQVGNAAAQTPASDYVAAAGAVPPAAASNE